MKALRWILFSLLAFGLGTGAAFALHPPTIGIPGATASGLSSDLTKIRDYAAQGRCDAVRGRLRGATAKIDGLDSRTSTATVKQLTDSLETVRTEALNACQKVSDEKIAAQQAEEDRQAAEEATTPSFTPVEPSEPATTPETGEEGITGEDDGSSTPEQPGGDVSPDAPTGNEGPGNSENSNGNGNGPGGGVGIPGEDAIRQRVEKERRKIEKQAEKIRRVWGQ